MATASCLLLVLLACSWTSTVLAKPPNISSVACSKQHSVSRGPCVQVLTLLYAVLRAARAVLILTDDQSDLLADATRDVMPALNEHIFDAGQRFVNYFVSLGILGTRAGGARPGATTPCTTTCLTAAHGTLGVLLLLLHR